MRPVIVTNAGNLSGRMKAQSEKYVQEVREAQVQNAKLVMEKAKQFSQRQFFSSAQLAKMGHPYSKVAPMPPMKEYIINRQSGTFYASWQMRVLKNAEGIYASVYNTAPWARYMVGTKKMIARPILDEALERTKDRRRKNLQNARKRGLYRIRNS